MIPVVCPNDWNATSIDRSECTGAETITYMDIMLGNPVQVWETEAGKVVGWHLEDGCYISAEDFILRFQGTSIAEFYSKEVPE